MESYESAASNLYEYTGLRKGRKLLAEKRRRTRINHSLQHIKNIVCSRNKQTDPNWEKMEKAEILETTVDYLRNVRKITRTPQETKETIQSRFNQGFSKCAEEMLSYMQSVPGVSDNLQRELRKHLSRRLSSHVQQDPLTSSQTHEITPTELPSSSSSYQRLTSVQAQYLQSSHAYAKAVDSTRENTSFSDSGYGGSPNRLRRPVPEHRHSSNLSDSELYQAESRMPNSVNDARVMEWLQGTVSYSQAQQPQPWRPW